ncbi:hypothetical protein K435DRAFT_650779 [Dendrothele bispora CBS 962.96]|uniref:DUF1793-domain-containing protein n=1 Tax=Dendrothele bispora (strain CBS 962.96) TaxID=1314807 RepID=A0A4S8MMA1_DENBC|nr:hypothetical protein K435DRAFT_650779 [Dendrothele bispora CBS 962.96]
MSPPSKFTFFKPLLSRILLIGFFFLTFQSLVQTQFTSDQNFLPLSYPLAIRSPYLNAWQSIPTGITSLTHDWPIHWNDQIFGWIGFVRIDGVPWIWLGKDSEKKIATIQSSKVTPTRSVFTLSAGNMALTITFFSPIETEDLTRQSIPFSYLSFECHSNDGVEHEVDVYTDTTAEWISGDRSNFANWTTNVTGAAVIHSATREARQAMVETSGIAEDATVYYAMANVDGITYQSGGATDVRDQFSNQGSLNNQTDSNFRAINNKFVVFGIAVNLGRIVSTSQPVVWGLGLFRDPITTYGSDSESRRPYFFSDPQFAGKSVQDVVEFSLEDYSTAVQRANQLDDKIQADSKELSLGDGGQYYNLVAMAARQAAAIDITCQDNGTNGTDIKAFLRNTGFDTFMCCHSRSVSDVSTLYANFPALLYLNSSWGGYLLDSLLQYQSSPSYGNRYAAPNLGSSYPLALGNARDTTPESMEDTANMLVMVLAHARISGDGSLIEKYYNLLKKWADYLAANAVHPKNQVSADNLATSVSDSSKIAMKAIIGVGAMAQISRAFSNSEDEMNYQSNAIMSATQWKSLALSAESIKSTYGDTDSYALMYDLYADLLLGTGLFDQDVYNAQSAMIQSATGGQFGIPIDSNSGRLTRSSWLMLVAGSLSKTNNTTENQLINSIFTRCVAR